jgi:MATE family multidrug resistance protein
LKTTITSKEILQLAAPISLALLIPQASFLTNTAFLGRLGERELGVNGITGIFYLMLSMIGYGLSSGIQVQMARRAGEGSKGEIAHLLSNGVMLSIFFSLALMFLSLWVAPLLFGLNLHNTTNALLSIDYIYIRIWGLPFLLVTQLFNAFYISIGKSKYLIYGSLAATVVNVVFDYLLIFGKLGLPVMGLAGAAISSILSEMIFCGTMAGLFYWNKMYRHYPVHRHLSFDLRLSRRSLTIAAPLIVQFMFSIGGWQIFFIFVEHLGIQALAASQILRSLFGIAGIGVWAFATTCSTMVSNLIGQGKQNEIISLGWKISRLSFLFALLLCGILFLFPGQFLSLYRNDAALVAYAIPSLQVIVVAMLIMSVSTVMFNTVVGTGNTLVNLSMEVCCVGCYLVYSYIVIERLRSPLCLCWGAEFVYWTTLLIGSLIYMESGKWKGKMI